MNSLMVVGSKLIRSGSWGALLELTKPRVSGLVVLTTAAGFYLASWNTFNWMLLAFALVGTAGVAGGTAVLNQAMERDLDGKMHRTAGRPLPAQRLDTRSALIFGLLLLASGSLFLATFVNPLTALLGCGTAGMYLLVYTPLKTRTSLCTTVGAIPGAMPPVMGWTAARGDLDLNAGLLFAILFLWQYPHFLSIAWVYREDYARGGFKMLPLLDWEGRRTSFRVVLFLILLLFFSLLPFFTQLTGGLYLIGALVLGLGFLWSGILLAQSRGRQAAKRVLRASVIYLPLLLVLMVFDKVPR